MKQDIYTDITNSIIHSLERLSLEDAKAPFAQLAGQDLPLNPTSGNGYCGINTLVLWFAQHEKGYASNEWGTYKQWQDKGAQVKKGEKSTQTIFYKRVEKKDAKEQDEDRFYNMLKSYRVFNADQVEGYEAPLTREAGTFGTVEQIAEIEHFIQNTGATIKADQDSACFVPSLDEIHMPRKDLFFEAAGQSATENYYAVLAHELTHWSGGASRLDRKQETIKNMESYAFEELIAELGSAYLCAHFGIKQQGRDDHATYIKSWLTALRSDKKYIFKAAAKAQQAVDFLKQSGRT